VNLLQAIFLDLEDGHGLHRAPAGDVPFASLPKDAVQQTCRAEQPDVARVQRSDRPYTAHLFPGHQEGLDLLPHRRCRYQVFDRIER
jgi:hypothetical protein